jgi:hypothetical protein
MELKFKEMITASLAEAMLAISRGAAEASKLTGNLRRKVANIHNPRNQ